MEGVEIEDERIGTVVFGTPTLKDRDEEAISGYRDALKLIHEQPKNLSLPEETHF